MKIKTLTLLALFPVIIFAQKDNTERINELKHYFWNKPDSNFIKTTIPSKWKNESAVIIAKQVEYSVKKKEGSTKLTENYYLHTRIKLMDNNAIDNYSKFSFAEDTKRHVGFFSKATTNYYLGIKVIKPDGTEEEVKMDEAIKDEISSGRKSYAVNKIAIPNLQVGDIIDYYRCVERKFPRSSFYELTPFYLQLADEYPIMNQCYKIKVLRRFYLNAKSINGAPEIKAEPTHNDNEISHFALYDSNREKLKDEEWVNYMKEIPALKFQAYFSLASYLSPGYQSFFGPVTKFKDSVNISALYDLLNAYTVNVKNSYHPSFSIYKSTYKFLKPLSKKQHLSTEELAKEAYYFIREYYYQQHFFILKQVPYYNSYTLNDITLTSIISSVLSKLKREHEIIFIAPEKYGNKEDVLFIGELTPGIKTLSDNPLIISTFTPNSIINKLPYYHSNSYAYAKNLDNDTKERCIKLPAENMEDNKSIIKSTVNFDHNFDSIHVKSRFEITGAERIGWDSVLFVSHIIQDDFKNDIYGKYIHDLSAFTPEQTIKNEIYINLIEQREKEEKERIKKIEEKIKDYWGVSDINFKNFKIINFGRWEDSPNLIFELDFTIYNKAVSVGDFKIVPIGYLAANKGLSLDKNRDFNIHLPYKRIVDHTITIENFNKDSANGLEQFSGKFSSDYFSYNSSYKTESNKLIINTLESTKQTFIDKKDWQYVVDFSKVKLNYSNNKLKVASKNTTVNTNAIDH